MFAKIATTLLLTRHILRTMSAHVLRTAIVWLALASALGVIIGVFSFSRSIDDSHRARGAAIRGVADLQLEAVAPSVFKPSLADDIEAVRGTHRAIMIDEQRIAIHSKARISHVATAFGLDRHARLLRSSLQQQLDVKTPKDPSKGGLTISTEMAAALDVKRGAKVRIVAFRRSPAIKIQRIQHVIPALSEVVALPRKSLERMRGRRGANRLYVQLDRGVSVDTWRKRVKDVLPDNAQFVTPSQQQHELDRVLSVTVRSYTYLFGAVALLIVSLLVYVLQLMRMLDRQEDAGLVRALGSNWIPLAAAEVLTLILMLTAALPAGLYIGYAFAHQLAGNLPEYLTQVFNFTMVVKVKPALVAIAAGATLGVASLATVGALIATRRPIADQLGRSPQSGATATARISLPAAFALTIAGAGLLALAGIFSGSHRYTATSITVLLGIAIVAPGLAALFTHALARLPGAVGPALLVARSAIESNPRRVAMSTAIMALAVSAVVPLQLLDHALAARASEMAGIHRLTVQRIVAGDDLFNTVPVHPDYLRQAIKEKHSKPKIKPPKLVAGQKPPNMAQLRRRAAAAELRRPLPEYAAPFVSEFTSYRGQRIAVMSIDSRRTWPFIHKSGDTERKDSASELRHKRNQVVISSALAGWAGLGPGDKVRLPTPDGYQSSRISSVIDDMSWPMGTVYFDITRYHRLFGSEALNAMIVKPAKIDREALKKMRPLHTYSGSDLVAR
ncbi:MAG: hypothetical protein JJE27_02620, partial [Thermoleophilia bacterium]|nr:hypothetical protein [Thermoleophilia bacterium]